MAAKIKVLTCQKMKERAQKTSIKSIKVQKMARIKL